MTGIIQVKLSSYIDGLACVLERSSQSRSPFNFSDPPRPYLHRHQDLLLSPRQPRCPHGPHDLIGVVVVELLRLLMIHPFLWFYLWIREACSSPFQVSFPVEKFLVHFEIGRCRSRETES